VEASLLGMLDELLDLSQCLFAAPTGESKSVYDWQKEEGRRPKENAVIAMVSAMKNILTIWLR
jgi:hypothetical protein